MISMVEVASWFRIPDPPAQMLGLGTTVCKRCGHLIALTPKAMREHVEQHIGKGELDYEKIC
jgi:hypothetical protein